LQIIPSHAQQGSAHCLIYSILADICDSAYYDFVGQVLRKTLSVKVKLHHCYIKRTGSINKLWVCQFNLLYNVKS